MNYKIFFAIAAVVVLAGCGHSAKDASQKAPAAVPATTTHDGDAMEDEAMEDGVMAESESISVTVNNVSDTQPLAPGVFIVHTKDASINFEGRKAPKSLEPLAEIGSNADFAAYIKGQSGILGVYTIDEPILPGKSAVITVDVPQEDALLSGVMMAVGSNDGYTLLDSALLAPATLATVNHDAGTEENNALLSGFAGGQPDPEKGAANVDNGTATVPQINVAKHTQLTQTVMQVVIAENAMENGDKAMKDDDAMVEEKK